MWAYVEAHIRPIIKMFANRHRHDNLPPWKPPDEPLQPSHYVSPQHRKILNEHHDFATTVKVAMHEIVAWRLARLKIWPPEVPQKTFGTAVQFLKHRMLFHMFFIVVGRRHLIHHCHHLRRDGEIEIFDQIRVH